MLWIKQSASYCFAIAIIATLVLPYSAEAESITAGYILDKMTSEEQVAYVAGIVEGLATARYYADEKDTGGMSCIYGWFYDDAAAATRKIDAAFDRYRTSLPGSIIATLIRQKCGG